MVLHPAKIKWAARLDHVAEASLFGAADLAYWQAKLAPLDLVPAAFEGAARMAVLAASARFKGVRFREVSFALHVEPPAGITGATALLVQAFNSQRFFAFVERAVFKTPYLHARVAVAPAPAAFRVTLKGQEVISAAMGASADQASVAQDDERYAVFLPRKGVPHGAPDRVFFAELRGETHTTPFVASRDTWTVSADSTAPTVCRMLHDSGFQPTAWTVRPDAHHAKSKTYRRDKVLPQQG